MLKLKSFVSGEWHGGEGKTATLLNPATEEPLAETGTGGIDFSAALGHARTVGGPALRAMTFAERAESCRGFTTLFLRTGKSLSSYRSRMAAIRATTQNSMSMVPLLPCSPMSMSARN